MSELGAGTIVVGLGGNIGDDAAIVRRFADARAALAVYGGVTSAPIYRSAPVGPPQPAYLNTAVRVQIAGPVPEPREWIEALRELERLAGRARERETRWGPRTLDLDVLLWGAAPIQHRGPPELIVPHPRLAERRFALRPAADVTAYDLVVPRTNKTLDELLAATADQELEVVMQTW